MAGGVAGDTGLGHRGRPADLAAPANAGGVSGFARVSRLRSCTERAASCSDR